MALADFCWGFFFNEWFVYKMGNNMKVICKQTYQEVLNSLDSLWSAKAFVDKTFYIPIQIWPLDPTWLIANHKVHH